MSQREALIEPPAPRPWERAVFPLTGIQPSLSQEFHHLSDSKRGNSRAALCLSQAWAAREQSVVIHQLPPPSGPEAGAARLHPTPTR